MPRPLLRPVLELRVHGVKNTLPAEMLGVKSDAVQQVAGDELGGFWATREETVDTPRIVHREAYSWGLLARTGGGALPLLGQLAVHLGWLFVLPFGLANVAYWTRRLEPQPEPAGWVPGRGASLLRIFGLGLTLLYVVALSSVALDLLGVRCVAERGACAPVAALIDPLAGLHRGARLALLAMLPLAAMLLLYVVARRGRVRYEASVSRMAASLAAERIETVPTLATPGFWSKARVGPTTERLHFAAVLMLLALLLAWDRVYSPLPQCTRPGSFLAGGCHLPDRILASSPASAIVFALSVAGLVAVVLVLTLASETPGAARTVRRRRATAGWLLVGGAALFTAALAASAVPTGEAPSTAPFLGLVAAPQILLAVLLAIALAALGWRRGVPGLLTALLLIPALAFLVVPYVLPGEGLDALWQLLAAAAVLAHLAVVWIAGLRDRSDHARTGWAGTGPGVVLLLSLGAAMVLASLLVVGVRAALGAPAAASGDVYAEFGVVLLGVVLVVAAVVGVVVLSSMTRLTRLTSAPLRGGGREVAPLRSYAHGRPERDESEDRLEVRVLRSRRFAALLHRGEPVLGVVAGALGVGLAATLVTDMQVGPAAVAGYDPPAVSELVLRTSAAVAVTVLGATAAAAVAAVAANALTHKERPVALLWDLICFLPRAGHPFGPPSYAERAVPELDDRIRSWLAAPSLLRRRVVVSAHSLGGVLAIATLFARYAVEEQPLRGVGLLTYGTQPRAYFGRFFPELFGPRVLGTRSSRRPALLGADPWLRQIRIDRKGERETFHGPGTAPTLSEILTTRGRPAWVSLWRRTDFLGFPVHSFASEGNPVDRGAAELEPGPYEKVATHSGYPATPQYAAAFAEVLERI
ncbi:hypothetical protein [Naasia sp. SYSU D00057]|uniref:hypothetical protein n=1 Tax=Naasia sp. SYSU D00057 TaxID=2817380 RepID=UPI001B3101FB|nr:hypothetical protein [Naasia sp. SYSU D00057]